jgi:hypothetical protein
MKITPSNLSMHQVCSQTWELATKRLVSMDVKHPTCEFTCNILDLLCKSIGSEDFNTKWLVVAWVSFGVYHFNGHWLLSPLFEKRNI